MGSPEPDPVSQEGADLLIVNVIVRCGQWSTVLLGKLLAYIGESTQ